MMRRGLREGGVPASPPGSDFPPVVVADDDRDVRAMLRTFLELDGHESWRPRMGFLKTDPFPKLRDKVRQYTSTWPGPPDRG